MKTSARTAPVQRVGASGADPAVRASEAAVVQGGPRPTEQSFATRLAASPRAVQQRRSLKRLFGAAVQLKIQVGDKTHESNDAKLISALAKAVQGQFSTWAERSKIKDKKALAAVARLEGSVLVKAVTELLAQRYDGGRAFSNFEDLRRQTEQDLILQAIGLPDLQGTEQQLDQFLQPGPKAQRGEGATRPGFRIYRCMKREYWTNYLASGKVQDILHGHGGSLGQALDYFRKSVASPDYDDVLVEFCFPDKSESQLVDPAEIEQGGEGKGPKNGKLGGKSEQNDLFGGIGEIYSINLKASKEQIAKWNPQVKPLAFSRDKHPGRDQAEKKSVEGMNPNANHGPLTPMDVMVRLKRTTPGSLFIMGYEDWVAHAKFKADNPDLKYSDE